MKKIVRYLKTHIKEDFHPLVYSYSAVFLVISFYINYSLDFEDKYIDAHMYSSIRMFYYFVLFSVAYYGVAVPMLFITGNRDVLKKRAFWIKSLVFMAMLGINSGFPYHNLILSHYESRELRYFFSKIATNSFPYIPGLIILFIIKRIYDRNNKGLYGLRFREFNARPYFLLLAIVTPLVIIASFNGEFQSAYPRFKPYRMSEDFMLSKPAMIGMFETVYGFNFVFVELFFRGALVIGMTKVLGRQAVLPMASAYAFLHFGKPMPEAISSIFGGYILGVISLNTQNILGGCIIHIGIAYLMEIAAYMQYYF